MPAQRFEWQPARFSGCSLGGSGGSCGGRPEASRDGRWARDVISRHAEPRRRPQHLKSLLCGCGCAPDAAPTGACGVRGGRLGGAPGSSGHGPPALGRARPRRRRRRHRCCCCCCYCCCWAARAHSTPVTCAAGRGGESCRRFQCGPPGPGQGSQTARCRAGGGAVEIAMLAKFADLLPQAWFQNKRVGGVWVPAQRMPTLRARIIALVGFLSSLGCGFGPPNAWDF